MAPFHRISSPIKRTTWALAGAIVALGFSACGTPPTAESLVSQGLKAQLSGDDTTAEATYEQALKLDPNNAVAHYDLGTIYDRQGNGSQAVTQYTAALVTNPTFVDALFNLAVDTASADPASAQRLYQRVLELQPRMAAAWLNLGFILRGDGMLSEAKADWAKAVALDASLASHVPTPSASTGSRSTPSPSTS